MKCALIACSAIAALTAGPACAADLFVKAAPPPLLWTGWYGGVNTGYSWGRSVASTDITATATYYAAGVSHRGWEASVEGGYCWQRRDTVLVACLEARYDFPAERSGTTTIASITGTSITSTTKIDPFLIGPHLGFLTGANHTFWYGAGGLAVGQVGGSALGTGLAGTSSASPQTAWATGWFLGAGMEQMIGQHWGIKIEYDYVALNTGGVTANYSGSNIVLNYPGFPATATVASHPYDSVVTVGINYHLN
jgi:outer membrane immunogenic protein